MNNYLHFNETFNVSFNVSLKAVYMSIKICETMVRVCVFVIYLNVNRYRTFFKTPPQLYHQAVPVPSLDKGEGARLIIFVMLQSH